MPTIPPPQPVNTWVAFSDSPPVTSELPQIATYSDAKVSMLSAVQIPIANTSAIRSRDGLTLAAGMVQPDPQCLFHGVRGFVDLPGQERGHIRRPLFVHLVFHHPADFGEVVIGERHVWVLPSDRGG